MHRRAGSALCPLPRSVGGAGGGGGGGWQVMSCLGDLERGRGDLWHVNLAGYVRVWIWRVSMARHFGGSAWRVYLAGQVGSFIWRVFKARGNACCWTMKRNRKERNVLWWICRLWYHYVASNIVLLLSLQVHQNQQIVVLQPWLCGSVNHTANRNKHHGEETRPLFCCSARLF
jgi:hypothetical protein